MRRKARFPVVEGVSRRKGALVVVGVSTAGTAYILSYREYTSTGRLSTGKPKGYGSATGHGLEYGIRDTGYGPGYGLEYRQDL